MKKIWMSLLVVVLLLCGFGIIYQYYAAAHTFRLVQRGNETIKDCQIQPTISTINVSGDCDTEVTFTDVETGEIYTTGYITSGVTEKIELEANKWYIVEGKGNLTVSPVNIRVE